MSKVTGVLSRGIFGPAKPSTGAAASSSSSSSSAASSSSSSSGKTPQEQFLADLAATYGPRIPAFHAGNYTDAVKAAKQSGRYLFLYLHCPSHDDTDAFLRRTLCDESVVNFLGENFVNWAGTIKHADAYRLCQTLNVASFPFLAVVAPHGEANSIVMVSDSEEQREQRSALTTN